MKIIDSKRILAALLALTLVLSVFPAPVFAAEDTCPCCGENMADIQWQALPANKSLPSGHYRVTEDAQMLRAYTSSGTTTIDLNGHTLTTLENDRAFYVYSKTLTILDTVGGGGITAVGAIDDNGGIIRVRSVATLNIYGGTFTGTELPAERKGGVLRVEGTVNMYGGTITGGKTHHHGGNVNVSGGKFNLYGGTIIGGETADVGRGGNIYLTEKSELNIYGGTVTGGKSAGAGGNIFAYKGATVNVYGGTIIDGSGDQGGHDIYVIGSVDGVYSTLNIFGGTVGSNAESLLQYADYNPINIYNGDIGADPAPYLADCACYNKNGDRYIVWNHGRLNDACSEQCPMEVAAEFVKTFHTGTHYYTASGRNTCTCSVCGSRYYNAKAVAVANGIICTDLTTAVGDVQLLDDVTVAELALQETSLDLNGFTLHADVVTAVNGAITDNTNGLGLLKTDSLALAEDNAHLAIRDGEGYRFASLTPDVTLERLDEDTVRVRFVFEEKAAQTQLDELINGGNTDVSVEFYLTWKNSQGEKKKKTYVCDPALLQKYAQKWDGRRFVATITGVEAVTDLTCTVRVAANGVTYSATTLKNHNKINNVLSWEDINSYPLKTSDMTVEEMRQLCVDFFEYSKTFIWTPDESVKYVRNSNGSNDSMSQGTVYGGMPYVGSASGNPYRYMDFLNPETGLLDMAKFLPELGTTERLTVEQMQLFGSQCAKTAGLGWGRVINSANIRATYVMTPANGVILLGDIVMDETRNWSESYRTTQVCQENGEQVIYEGYAQLKKADGLVYYTTAGHVIMAYEDAVVVRNEDGTINGDESYLYHIDQAQSWKTATNEAGDTYRYKGDVAGKMTFKEMFDGSYIPFTFAEFVSGDPVEETTFSLTEGETTIVSGTIRESDRAYVTDTTVEAMTFSQLCGTTLNTNYGITEAYIIVYNSRGQELYKHAVYCTTAGQQMKMTASGDRVFTWEYGKVTSGETYYAELVVQLLTGERPTVWSGDLLMDK